MSTYIDTGAASTRKQYKPVSHEPMLNFDATERKHGGNANSSEAHARNLSSGLYTRQEDEVCHALRHTTGATMKAVAEAMGVTPNVISGRFLVLEGKHETIRKPARIAKTDKRDKGSAIYRSLEPRCTCAQVFKFTPGVQ